MPIGLGVDLAGFDPIKALVWSAVLNGIAVVPILAAMMIVASRREQMGKFVATTGQKLGGWATTVMMTAAAVGLFARDLGQINGFLLTLVFFLTPICYPGDKLPGAAMAVLQKSPIFKLVAEYRLLFISEAAPDWPVLGQLTAMGLVAFYLGYGVFRKLRPSFPDVL